MAKFRITVVYTRRQDKKNWCASCPDIAGVIPTFSATKEQALRDITFRIKQTLKSMRVSTVYFTDVEINLDDA